MAIFEEGGGFGNGCAGGWLSNDTVRAIQFKELADEEVDRALRGFAQSPPRFYPVCFLYRHALELMLKEIVRDADDAIESLRICGSLSGMKTREARGLRPLIRSHGLGALLIDYVIPRLRIIDAPTVLPIVREVIDAFDAIDPRGQTFRYSVDTNDSLTLPEWRRYDLARIKAAVDEACRELGRADNWASITAEQCREYIGEMASYG